MKYLSLVVFVVALAWTWGLVHKTPSVSFETHSGIQEGLANLIQDTIRAKKPSASSVLINKLWTEIIGPEKVRAFFEYTYTETSEAGDITSTIQGEGVLQRQGDDGSGNDRWALLEVKTTSDAIVFDEGLIVTAGPESETSNSPPQTETEATSGETPAKANE